MRSRLFESFTYQVRIIFLCAPVFNIPFLPRFQLLPLFVQDVVGRVPAVMGLFMSALTSSALSTLSSVLNSAASLIWRDFCTLLISSDDQKSKSSKYIKKFIGMDTLHESFNTWHCIDVQKPFIYFVFSSVIICGVLVFLLTFLADNFGPHILQVFF